MEQQWFDETKSLVSPLLISVAVSTDAASSEFFLAHGAQLASACPAEERKPSTAVPVCPPAPRLYPLSMTARQSTIDEV